MAVITRDRRLRDAHGPRYALRVYRLGEECDRWRLYDDIQAALAAAQYALDESPPLADGGLIDTAEIWTAADAAPEGRPLVTLVTERDP